MLVRPIKRLEDSWKPFSDSGSCHSALVAPRVFFDTIAALTETYMPFINMGFFIAASP